MVSRLLAPNPEHRPPDAAWVADCLAEMAAGPVAPVAVRREEEDVVEDTPPAEVGRPFRLRRGLVLGAVGALGVLGAGAAVVLGDRRADPVTTPPAVTPVESVSDVKLDLAEPADRGNQVMLTWTSSSDIVDYAVIVAPENEPNRTVLAGRAHAITIPVDPVRRYCFELQATDGRVIYTSPPRSIRGAACLP